MVDFADISEDALRTYNNSKHVDASAVWLQFAVMTSVSLIVVLLFSLLRPRNKVVYAPKAKQSLDAVKHLPKLNDSLFSWVKPMFSMKESQLVDKIGLDAVTFIRFLRLLCEVFGCIVVICCGALIPINTVYNYKYIDEADRTWLDATTIIAVSGRVLWAHCAAAYFIVAVVLWRIWVHTREMVTLRKEWFRSEEYQTSLYARTLLIQNLPKKLMSDRGLLSILKSDPNALNSRKNKRSIEVPYEFSSTHVSRRVGKLPTFIEKHNNAVKKLEQTLTTYFKKGTIANRPRPLHRVGGFLCFGGKQVDAITYYTDKIKRYETQIEATRDNHEFKKAENFGFASLVSIPAAHVVAQKCRNKHPNGTNIELAPNPRDIIWSNLTNPPSGITKMWGWLFLAFVCFLNTVPLVFISFLANISATAVYFEGLRDWQMAGIFAYYLPIIIRKLTQYKGAATESRLDRAVIARLFAFLIISQLFIFTLIGVAFRLISSIVSHAHDQNSLSEITATLKSLPSDIESAYVSQASFWLKWFPMRGFLVFFDLAQLTNLIFIFIRTHVFGRTPRDIKEWTSPPPFEYAVYYASMLFMASVAMIYAPIAPLVAAAAFIIFLISAFVQKYQLMYVFVTGVETGGRIWNVIMNRMLFSLIAMQLIVLLSLGLKMGWGYGKWAAAIPPIIAVIVFKYMLNRKFSKQFYYYLPGSVEAATSKVHNQNADVNRGRLAKRFGHAALHADLFTIQVHDKHVHLLEQVLPEFTHKSNNFKEEIVSDGLKFEAVTEEQLEELPIRDRGEMDWDFRSLNSAVAGNNIDRTGAGTPGSMYSYYQSTGPTLAFNKGGMPSILESKDTLAEQAHNNDFGISTGSLHKVDESYERPLLDSMRNNQGVYSPVNLNDEEDEATPTVNTFSRPINAFDRPMPQRMDSFESELSEASVNSATDSQKHFINLEPTVQTEIVTTTKKTIIDYPEIPVNSLRSEPLQLNRKQYPLCTSQLPESVASFNFSLPNGHTASYQSYDVHRQRSMDSPPKKKLRDEGVGVVGSSGSVRSPLPSPLASPPRFERSSEWDDSGAHHSHSHSHTSSHTHNNTLPVLLSFPHLLNVYPSLSTATQSHILLNLLRLSDITAIRNVHEFISPALQKDFVADLPLEISSLILNQLDIDDLGRAATVSKTWRRLIDQDRAAWKSAGIRSDLWFGDEDHLVAQRQEAYQHANRTTHCASLEEAEQDSIHKTQVTHSSQPTYPSHASRTPLTPPPVASSESSTPPAKSPSIWKSHPYKHILKKRHAVRNNWFENEPRSSIEFERHGQNVVTCLQFDSDKIVTASDGDDKSIDISCTKTGRLRKRLRGHTGGVWALQYVGDTLVSGATDRTVRVWDIPSGRCTHVLWGHFSTVRCLAIIMPKWNVSTREYEPPYPIIVSGSRDFTIRIWRLPSPTRDEPWTINDGDVRARDNPWPLKLLSGHTNAVRSVAGDGRTLVSGSYDFTVRIWDTVTGNVQHVLRGHNDMVYKVVLDAPRNRCASGSYDGSVKVWSTNKGEQLQSLDGHSSLVGLLGLNSNSLISAGADSNLKIWNLRSGECEHVLDGHDSAISCMAHDEQKIISGSDGMLKMWNARDGKLKKDILSNLMHIWQVAISDRYLVAASNKMSGQTFINVFDFGTELGDEEVEYSRLNWEPQWWTPTKRNQQRT
ncbi:hypothetical protein E3P81_02563 [Wallemia ichthyophaga]|nr:hypothetical protein E3P97_02634 [Wallemia ichthyophaga]TIB31421.1 hypothetical protein E3P85_02287 [Wallemia ichthyophaga]TIB49426.1 hypothetical protein E3P81_02563 [Wallemia ichthyophaga]TIB52531.1 hypothetical protein E3P80_02564 [Wallemia ichthyophaga]TIB58041.1 hypothetical protein E3P79_02562 [Wallemia ichthyophaga]